MGDARQRRRMRVCVVLSIALFWAAPTPAETVAVVGEDGDRGVSGADGDPGGDGTSGGDGASAEAVADAVGEDNHATALGGRGGNGGGGGWGAPAGADAGDGGDGGDGGDAVATAIVSEASFAEATAFAGEAGYAGLGGSAQEPGVAGADGSGGSGGSALAVVDADHSGALVHATGTAFGGTGGFAGGDARVEVFASTSGDSHDVAIGPTPGLPKPFQGYAIGGGAADPLSEVPGVGGNATHHAVGIAEGNSAVSVEARALGGGDGLSRPGAPTTRLLGGVGGDALATATAAGGGTATVRAVAEAVGGPAGGGSVSPGRGGAALAQASASGLGEVRAEAVAEGGLDHIEALRRGGFGAASARAIAQGAAGSVVAEARASVRGSGRHRARSEADVTSHRETAAALVFGGALSMAPSDPALHGNAFLVVSPLTADVAAARADNGALDALFAGAGNPSALALGRWEGEGDTDGPLSLTSELEIGFDEDQGGQKLFLAAFETSVLGDGFGSLDFSLVKNGELLETHSFDDASAMLAFFDDALFGLGAGWLRSDQLVARFALEVTGDTSVAMGFAFVQAVPEPGTGVLLIFGLVVLARRRARA